MPDWPYKGDSPVARARRVAHAYRAVAEQHAPDATAQLDARIMAVGETWAVPYPVPTDPDEWLSSRDAAAVACVNEAQLRVYRSRGLITGRKRGRGFEYRAGDIHQLITAVRKRGRNVADTVTTNGRTAPERQKAES